MSKIAVLLKNLDREISEGAHVEGFIDDLQMFVDHREAAIICEFFSHVFSLSLTPKIPIMVLAVGFSMKINRKKSKLGREKRKNIAKPKQQASVSLMDQ